MLPRLILREACGVSEDTLARRRKLHKVSMKRPTFTSMEEAQEWWRSLGATEAKTTTRPSRRRKRAPVPVQAGPTLAMLKQEKGDR